MLRLIFIDMSGKPLEPAGEVSRLVVYDTKFVASADNPRARSNQNEQRQRDRIALQKRLELVSQNPAASGLDRAAGCGPRRPGLLPDQYSV